MPLDSTARHARSSLHDMHIRPVSMYVKLALQTKQGFIVLRSTMFICCKSLAKASGIRCTIAAGC